jgi:hypothetical protein
VRAYSDRGHGGADAISPTSLDIVLAAIAAAAAAVAVWRSILAGQQAREAKKARELSAVISLFNAHQSEDHSHIRRLIRHGTIADHLDDQEIRVQLRHYINQLNFIATLRARQLLDDELVKDLFYEPARACWEQCAKTFVREIYSLDQPTSCLQSQIGRELHLRRQGTAQVEAAAVLSVIVRSRPAGTPVNGRLVARPAMTTYLHLSAPVPTGPQGKAPSR